LNASDPIADAAPPAASDRRGETPRAWTRHGLNSGLIFSATVRGVRVFPRTLSYALGDAGSWLAWRLMTETRNAVVENRRAISPRETEAGLRRGALATFRSYARDVVDFLRALRATDEELRGVFDFTRADVQLFTDLLAKGRGIILVSGHYGNWEVGSVFMRRTVGLGVTIMEMTEASPEGNRIRRDIRDHLGVDTIEVRKSLDTALQIRRRLADNRIVAMLMDRHIERDRVEVRLLGRRTWFLKTPALMGFLSGAPLVPCFIERTGPARFTVRAGEPIVVSADRSREDAIQQAAQRFADQLGARIRTHPEYWYHFYRYWKDAPDTDDRPA
jgi:lauroyl/myristoyl acyltransferase